MFIQKLIKVENSWWCSNDFISNDIQDICKLYAELDPVPEDNEAIKVTNFGHQLTLYISANEITVWKHDFSQEKKHFCRSTKNEGH